MGNVDHHGVVVSPDKPLCVYGSAQCIFNVSDSLDTFAFGHSRPRWAMGWSFKLCPLFTHSHASHTQRVDRVVNI